MPTLSWMGKEKVVNHHRDVPYRVLERIPQGGSSTRRAPTAAT